MSRALEKRPALPDGGAGPSGSAGAMDREEVNEAEASVSRIQYPPAAAKPRARMQSAGQVEMQPSNSSSSLFWRATGAPHAPAEPGQNEKGVHQLDDMKDPLMDDALRSLPPASKRQPSRPTVMEKGLQRTNSRISVTSSSGRPRKMERTTSIPTQGAPSIASSKSIVGGWKEWLSTRTGGGAGARQQTAKRAEAGRRLDKKLKRAEKRSRRKKRRAGRDSRRSMSSNDSDNDSDSEILVTMNEQITRPSLDVPPPNETTATALSKVASRKAPKLHFAPEERKIRRKDLPQDYEQGDMYRGIDDYVKASRDWRRQAKRIERRRGSKGSRASSRGSRSSVSKSSMSSGESSSSSSSDGSSSTGSSSSSASGRLTMARLRAFFGDSSSSSSSSSSSDSSSTSSSTSGSRSSHSTASSPSFRLFRRRRPSRTGSDSGSDRSPPATPRTPALTFQIKGGAQRRRKQRAVKRYRAQEKRLIEEGKIPPRPSKKARHKAKLAREQAGGVTEYILFTPIALSNSDFAQKHHHHPSRPAPPLRSFTNQRANLPHSAPSKAAESDRVLQTVSFYSIKERLHALRRHRRQLENAGGDIALEGASGSVQGMETKDADAVVEDRIERDDLSDLADFEDGDLSLPPPAMDLPKTDTLGSSSTRKKRPHKEHKIWHMSDVPLTPHVQMASDFARGFEVGSPRKPSFSSSPQAHGMPSFGRADDGQEVRSEAHSSSANTKVPSGGPSGVPSPPENEAHAAWWLDISCPTYRDMTELSKMFPLHPLTVEDVLQQDTREKVEVFESLNYYFVIVRAIDEKYFKYTSASAANSDQQVVGIKSKATAEKGAQQLHETPDGNIEMSQLKETSKKPRVDIVEGVGGKEGLEGVSVGAVNLYLIVFSHGIISFHFEDITKHTDRVRNRLLDLTQPVELTSDWIAHGLFDSIIDSFFPLLSFLETEVEEIEVLTSEPLPKTRREAIMASRNRVKGVEKGEMGPNSLPVSYVHQEREHVAFRVLPWVALPSVSAHLLPQSLITVRTRVQREPLLDGPAPLPRSMIQRIFGINRKQARVSAFLSNSAQGQSKMLKRITETRKIVTGLSRLLTPKNDSVRGLRKRLVELRGPSMSVTEMTIYMGDVHDHIVSLLSHLASSDNRLGDIHFSYLCSIRINNNRVSHSTDEILVVLATITVTVLSTVCFISLFSLNVTIPHNVLRSPTYHWFGGVVAFACCIPLLIALRTWSWIRQSKQKTAARRAVR